MSLTLFLILVSCALAYALFKPNTVDPTAGYKAELIKYTKGTAGQTLALLTFYLRYPRFIHSEMMTHKDFSRSASSSRAIPVLTMLKQVWNEPAMPVVWGINKAGMQATDQFDGWKLNFLKNLWQLCGRTVCVFVWVCMKMKVHKQLANRMLEPWQWMHVTLTTCKVRNFYTLRIHHAAQPEINFLAQMMKAAQELQEPVKLYPGEWHLPWIDGADYDLCSAYIAKHPKLGDYKKQLTTLLLKMSAARCARSSYANFGGFRTVEGDLDTYQKLVVDTPVHASPCEHQATPDVQSNNVDLRTGTPTGLVGYSLQWDNPHLHGNLTGYVQYRNTIPQHYTPD